MGKIIRHGPKRIRRCLFLLSQDFADILGRTHFDVEKSDFFWIPDSQVFRFPKSGGSGPEYLGWGATIPTCQILILRVLFYFCFCFDSIFSDSHNLGDLALNLWENRPRVTREPLSRPTLSDLFSRL